MKEKKKSNQTTYDNPLLFFQAFSLVYRAGEVLVIKDGKEQSYSWDIYSATVYCFLYNRINNQKGDTRISLEYIAGDCNCSVSTCKQRIYNMEEMGILSVTRENSLGVNKVNTYNRISNIITSPRFKLKPNKYRQHYLDMVKDRKKRKALLQGIVVKKSWTKLEIMNYIRNTNYELRTGEYLVGDKLSSLLYLKEVQGVKVRHIEHENFKVKDELKEYELNQLIETVDYED